MITTRPELESHTLIDGQYRIHYVAAGDPQRELIDDAGHCANMDNPSEFNALLLEWLRRYE